MQIQGEQRLERSRALPWSLVPVCPAVSTENGVQREPWSDSAWGRCGLV